MVLCPSCGNNCFEGNFCGECGYKLRREYMVCPSCYHKSVHDEYCIKCGTKLKSGWRVSSDLRRISMKMQYNLNEQIKVYDKLIEINPDKTSYRAFKSHLLLDLGKFDEAIECLDEGLSFTPKDTYLLVKKADIYKNCAQKDKAMEYLHEALEFDPTNLDALESKISLLKSIGKEDETQIYLKKILEITPNEFNITRIARSLDNIGEYDEAIKYYEKEKDMDPDFNSALYICPCFIKMHKFDEAIKCINSEMESNPYDNSLKIIKANIYSEMGEYDKAIDIYDNILDDGFKNRTLMEKANIFIKMKRDDEAKTCLLSIQDEDNLYLWARLAKLYKEIKDYQNALNCCEKALSIFPQDKSVLLLKAELYFELGQYNDSVITCADLYMLNPYYEGLSELREKIRRIQGD